VHVTFLARNRPLIKLKNTVESEHPKSSVAWNSLINKTYLLFKNIKKTIFYGGLIIAMALLMPLASHSQSSKTNFSGNWTVNQSKNQMPGGEKMGDSYFTVSQNEKEMIVTNHGIQGSIRYNLDGKESVNSTPQGDNKSVATWSADGKTLNISTLCLSRNRSDLRRRAQGGFSGRARNHLHRAPARAGAGGTEPQARCLAPRAGGGVAASIWSGRSRLG
jgi:hypothetical protein